MSESDPGDRSFQFHLEEFKQLKTEILLQQRIQFSIDAGAATAVFAVLGYLGAHEGEVVSRVGQWAWWLPVGIVAVAFNLSRAFVNRAYQIGGYIREMERIYARNEQGWETHLHPVGQTRRKRISPAKRWFWLFLLAVSLVVAIAMTRASIGSFFLQTLQIVPGR